MTSMLSVIILWWANLLSQWGLSPLFGGGGQERYECQNLHVWAALTSWVNDMQPSDLGTIWKDTENSTGHIIASSLFPMNRWLDPVEINAKRHAQHPLPVTSPPPWPPGGGWWRKRLEAWDLTMELEQRNMKSLALEYANRRMVCSCRDLGAQASHETLLKY